MNYTTTADTFEGAIDEVLAELKTLMVKKQRDYSSANILECGEVGVVVRMNDKMARIKNLFGVTDGTYKFRAAQNESVDDSFRDIANYGIIALLLRRKKFGLPLASNVTIKGSLE